MPKVGEDARLYARRALDYGDANASSLADAAARYGALAAAMARPIAPASADPAADPTP